MSFTSKQPKKFQIPPEGARADFPQLAAAMMFARTIREIVRLLISLSELVRLF